MNKQACHQFGPNYFPPHHHFFFFLFSFQNKSVLAGYFSNLYGYQPLKNPGKAVVERKKFKCSNTDFEDSLEILDASISR